ncbi:MAG: hypothetical protein AMXMBFR4_28420 [Candidatus Hydrogenedentota bacterium]
MRPRPAFWAVTLLLAGCGPPDKMAATPTAASTAPAESATFPGGTPEPGDVPAPARPAAPAASDTVRLSGSKLTFFSDVLESDQPKTPTFEVSAPRLSMIEENIWVLEDATAVAYSADGDQTLFRAGTARFDDNAKAAELGGGVRISMGTQSVELTDVVWSNTERAARSANPVVVVDGDTRVEAAAMEYQARTKTLLLDKLSGAISMSAPNDEPAPFSHVDINKGGRGEFVAGRLRRITGGVDIALRSRGPDAQPMQLIAQDVAFKWAEGETLRPAAIELKSGVRVDGPQGIVTAGRADLDVMANRLTFSGDVKGSSESIAEFDADRIVFDLDANDSEMTNLRARGIAITDGGQGGNAYSSMDIERAGTVMTKGGHVERMAGGVSIVLSPGQASQKPLRLNASDAVFSWSGNQPSSIQLRGGVSVDSPQGAIKSSRADFNLAKNQLDFSGNVNGSLPRIRRFEAEKLAYNMASGETLLTGLKAKGLRFGTAPVQAASEGAPAAFSEMDIERAPEVSISDQKINWMRGGVLLIARNSEPGQPSLTISASELTFHYDDDGESPAAVDFAGPVDVEGPETHVVSDEARLDFAANALTFKGNVSGDSARMKSFTVSSATYNLETGALSWQGGLQAEEIQHDSAGQKEAKN